jgi:hypothetical protein
MSDTDSIASGTDSMVYDTDSMVDAIASIARVGLECTDKLGELNAHQLI